MNVAFSSSTLIPVIACACMRTMFDESPPFEVKNRIVRANIKPTNNEVSINATPNRFATTKLMTNNKKTVTIQLIKCFIISPPQNVIRIIRRKVPNFQGTFNQSKHARTSLHRACSYYYSIIFNISSFFH